MKFGRTYTVKAIGVSGTPYTFTLPLTMTFDVVRHNLAGLNEGTISLYNLNQVVRQDLFFDRTPHPGARMIVQAGYASEPNLSNIFNGTITDGYSERVGPDIVTRLHGIDGLTGVSTVQSTDKPLLAPIPPGTSLSNRVKILMQKYASPTGISDVVPGQVNILPPEDLLSTDWLNPVDSVWLELQKLVPQGGSCFVDNGKIHFLTQNTTLLNVPGPVQVTDTSGILNIPKKTLLKVEFDMMFESSFLVGAPLTLNSSLSPWINGAGYKITSIHQHGVISAVESGDAITTLELLSPAAPVPVGL